MRGGIQIYKLAQPIVQALRITEREGYAGRRYKAEREFAPVENYEQTLSQLAGYYCTSSHQAFT